jgi:hypothetical protein
LKWRKLFFNQGFIRNSPKTALKEKWTGFRLRDRT